jgi:protein phosphatase PTC2/3
MTDTAVHPSAFATMADFKGDRVAKYAGENVHEIVKKQEAFAKEDYVKALQDGFIATDTALLEGAFSLSRLSHSNMH